MTSEDGSQIVQLFQQDVKVGDILSQTGTSTKCVYKKISREAAVVLRNIHKKLIDDDKSKYCLLKDELLKNIFDEATVPTTASKPKSITQFEY